MPTEYAYPSEHMVIYHLVLAYVLIVETSGILNHLLHQFITFPRPDYLHVQIMTL